MEYSKEDQSPYTKTVVSIIVTILILYKIFSYFTKRSKNLPPSPKGSLPIIGHMHLLGKIFHRSLYKLSQNLGPIISLKFGSELVVIVSSANLINECFNKNDIISAGRPTPSMDHRSLGSSPTSVIGAPYGEHWRNLRKLLDLEVFSPSRLASSLATRRDEMNRMIISLYAASLTGFVKVNVETKIVEMIFNNILRMIAGKRYYGVEANLHGDEEAKEFRELTKEALELIVASNPGEVFPILRWLGFTAIEKRLAVHARKMDDFMMKLLDEHRQAGNRGSSTMIDHLLSLQVDQPQYYTDKLIMELIVVLIIAGTDASVVATEWVMAVLISNPEVLNKARQEIDVHVGHNRMVEEGDLPKLCYLRCVILETLRLYPPVPTLVPHQMREDCVIGGYNIPKGTKLIGNAWAVHRDPEVWEDPFTFKPERFESIEVENHKLLPFGMGRRSCPGAVLAHKFMGLAVASLVQCFDWERPTTLEKIDLSERNGFILSKAEALEAMCKPRDVMKCVLEQLASNYN